MPRYSYRCSSCGNTNTLFHSVGEQPEVCLNCLSGSLERIYDWHPPENKKKQQVGEVTKEFIEDAKQELEKQKKEAKKEYK